jgi:hypothetical protein
MKTHTAFLSKSRVRKAGRQPRGFALVVTVLLMVLMTMIALALLTLSSVSLRSSGQGDAMALARGNARLSLMLALGELQATLGTDQSISAPASAVIPGATRPHLTGAWESWRWTPGSGGAPDYTQKAAKFRSWLVSSAMPAGAESFNLPSQAAGNDAVELVGALQNDGRSNSVKAQKVQVRNGSLRGGLAWAVFDESTKAAIDLGDPLAAPTKAEEIASRTAPHRYRADSLSSELESLTEPKNLVSLETAVIPGGNNTAPDFRRRFHDFTTSSLGLLTNPATGGLKGDLTSLFEATAFPSTVFADETPYFSIREGAPRWRYLYDHYRKYKTIQTASNGTPRYSPPTAETSPNSVGIDTSPQRERLLPVVAKFQLVFSVVSHRHHIRDRVDFHNTMAEPRGNAFHAVPHLAYDPVITLYNPYDVGLDLRNMRIRVWDPPVGFRLMKVDKQKGTSVYYRPEMASGKFHGLAQFQIANEKNLNARKFFTLQLTDGNSERAGSSLRLLPGEVKVFSPRIENAWTWGYETGVGNGYEPRSFFDWNAGSDFGNIDRRTNNQWGIEAVPGWDARAGLQTDHMSYAGRPRDTLYDFEWDAANNRQRPGVGGFLSMRLTDEVRVEARPERTTGGASGVPDFQIDLLASRSTAVTSDILRSYKFRFADLINEISEYPNVPTISRSFTVSDTLQLPDDKSLGLKKPFAMLEMGARTTKDPLDDTKPWLYNNPVIEGAEQTHSVVGPANQSYDVRLINLTSFTSFPGIEIDPDTKRGFFGASKTSSEGSTNVPMMHVPVIPASSLGDWVSSNLVSGSVLPRVVHPFGNSRAHPLIPVGSISRLLGGTTALDHSYLLNDAFWDSWFFSSITDYNTQIFGGNRTRKDVLTGVIDGTRPALNSRLAPVVNPGDVSNFVNDMDGLSDLERSRSLAAHLGIRGAFNVNSTSVDAWRALLSALRDQSVNGWSNRKLDNSDRTPFARTSLPLAGSADSDSDSGADVLGQIRWAGFRTLDDGQIETLARAIVTEIQSRGNADKAPSLTLGEFVNRRPGSSLHGLSGLLQTAIDKSGVNQPFHALDSKPVSASAIGAARKLGTITPEVMDGQSAEGAPSILTQGDLMSVISAVATVRGDTFKIRGYGEALASNGTTVLAKAWCEAVVQRVPEYVDPSDEPETSATGLSSDVNKLFGRRFTLVSFRWINPAEI